MKKIFTILTFLLIQMIYPGSFVFPQIIEHSSGVAEEDGKSGVDADGIKNGIVVWAGEKKHLLRGTYYVYNQTLRIEPGAVVEVDQSSGGSIMSNSNGVYQYDGATLNNLTLNASGSQENYIRSCILNDCKIRNSGWMEISECQFNSKSRGDIIEVFNKDFPDAIPTIKNNYFSYTENYNQINLLGANAVITGNTFKIEKTKRGYDRAILLGHKQIIDPKGDDDPKTNDTIYFPQSGKTEIKNKNKFGKSTIGFLEYDVVPVPHKMFDQYPIAVEINGNTFEYGRDILIHVHNNIQIINNTFNGRAIYLKKYPVSEGSSTLRKPHEKFIINNNQFNFGGGQEEAIIYWKYVYWDDPIETLRNEGFFIDATNNWWGHQTGPFNDNDLDGDVNFGGGLKISDIIDYKPFVGSGPASDIEMELIVTSNSDVPFHPHNNVTFNPAIKYKLESGEGNIELDILLDDGTLFMTTPKFKISSGDRTVDLSSLEIEIPENTKKLIFQGRFLTSVGSDSYSNKVSFDVHLQSSTIRITETRLDPQSEGNYLFQGRSVNISLDLVHTFTATNSGNTGNIEIVAIERSISSPLIIRQYYNDQKISLIAMSGKDIKNTVDMNLNIPIRDVDDAPSEIIINVKLTTDANVEVSTSTSFRIDKLTNKTEILGFGIKDIIDGKTTISNHNYFKANEKYLIGIWFSTNLRTPNASEWRLVPKLIFYGDGDNEIETRYFRQDENSPPLEFKVNYGTRNDDFNAVSLNPVPANAKKCKIIFELISSEGKIVHQDEKEVDVRIPAKKEEKSAEEGNSLIEFDTVPISINLSDNQTSGNISAYEYSGNVITPGVLAKSLDDEEIIQLNRYWELVSDLKPGTFSAQINITYSPEVDFPEEYIFPEDAISIAVIDTLTYQLKILETSIDLSTKTLSVDIDNINNSYILGVPSNLVTDTRKEENIPLPSSYALSNNYPNPFNPSTTINYEIPLRTAEFHPARPAGGSAEILVTLKVYDILGKEIVSLVNQKQKPGNYEIQFNASPFSSGVYFYQLIAGDFVATKKLVLMK